MKRLDPGGPKESFSSNRGYTTLDITLVGQGCRFRCVSKDSKVLLMDDTRKEPKTRLMASFPLSFWSLSSSLKTKSHRVIDCHEQSALHGVHLGIHYNSLRELY